MPTPYGEWFEGPQDSKVVAIHACLLHTGQVLFFHCRSYPFWTRLYDPTTNEVSMVNYVVPKWPVVYDLEEPPYLIQPSKIFCSGHCFLPDGRLLVAGGELNNPYPDSKIPIAPDRGLRYSFIFNPEPDSVLPSPALDYWKITGEEIDPFIMDQGRWYPTLTLMNDGKVLCIGGLTDEVIANPFHPEEFIIAHNRIVEIYDDLSGWTKNNNVESILPPDISYSYPQAHLIPIGPHSGNFFYATTQIYPSNFDPPSEIIGYSQIYNPNPVGLENYWTPITNRRTSPTEAASGVLMPIRLGTEDAKVIVVGGRWDGVKDRIDIINLADSTPEWESDVQQLLYPRYNHNCVILPDRSLLILGGNYYENHDPEESVLIPELLDTDTMEWISQDLPPLPVPRNYHSTAILLPSAKVLMGGGRVPDGGDVEDDTERRFSIFKPGYLMDGDRPEIVGAPEVIYYNDTFPLELDGTYTVDSFVLMKPGSVTHGLDMDQRYIELKGEMDIGPGPVPNYTVYTPADSNLAPPGYYMLFVLKDKSESTSGNWKIPSCAKFVKLEVAP